MKSLAWADQKKIAYLVRDLYSLDSLTAFSERMLLGMHSLIGGTSVIIGHERARFSPSLLASSVGSQLERFAPILAAEHAKHPGVRYHRAHPGRPVAAISDLLQFDKWKKTVAFNEVYSKLEMQEQLGAGSPITRFEYLVVIVNRARRNFTERDRAVLNLLRPHISEAWKVARMRTHFPTHAMTETLETIIGGSVITLTLDGTVQSCSRLAQRQLEVFFSAERPFPRGLPASIANWIRRESSALENIALTINPKQPLTVRRGEKTLEITLGTSPDRSGHVLFLRVEDPAAELAKLNHFRLGNRATQVLYWLAKGKTNEEIGIILGMASETVKAHLKRIFPRLNVENRSSAISMVVELLLRTPVKDLKPITGTVSNEMTNIHQETVWDPV